MTGLPSKVDISEMLEEFEAQAAIHTGKGELFYKHYIISLAPGEELTPAQWFEFADEYLEALGYDESTKWTAVEHRDTDSRHIHIFTCLVKDKPCGPLVRTHNDAHAGFAVMRKLEKKFGMRELENPEANFGYHFRRFHIKADGGREEVKKHDWSALIRSRFAAVYEHHGRPYTMTELVLGLATRGVEVRVKQDELGAIIGISYKADGGPWIGGSKIKATRFTWQKLIPKERISYLPARDDAALGIASGMIEFNLGVRICAKSVRNVARSKQKVSIIKRNDDHYATMRFHIPNANRKMLEMIEFMEAVMKWLSKKFDSKAELIFDERMQKAASNPVLLPECPSSESCSIITDFQMRG